MTHGTTVRRSDVWFELASAFGHFDRADSWRALIATMTLFRTLARETAAMLGFSYPENVDTAISQYVDRRRAAEEA